MKRIIIAAVCLVLAISLAVFGFLDLRKITAELSDSAARVIAVTQTEDAQAIRTELQAFSEKFAKEKKCSVLL